MISTSPFVTPKSTMISPQETGGLAIRDPRPVDEADWRRLWSGYCAFYETEVPEAVTAATWGRMLAPGSPLFGRIAEWDGQVAGFTVSVLHEGSWTTKPCCYLEDLFVAPDFRGKGIARALIEDQLKLCRDQPSRRQSCSRSSISVRAMPRPRKSGSTKRSSR